MRSTERPGGALTRRKFLKRGLIGAALLATSAACGQVSCRNMRLGDKGPVSGRILGSNVNVGHMLNKVPVIPSSVTDRVGVVIVGGGISGLSAARELRKNRFGDFLLLELEERPGGNAQSGSNPVSSYPWAAHYIPIPGEDAVFVRELFEELGIIVGYDSGGLPVYNEYHLCADPQERLFIHGQWQEGLVPQLGVPDKDKRQYDEFFLAMKNFREARGRDGRRAFSIPLELSSNDSSFLKYDSVTMDRYLHDNGWDSEYLRWYIDYCCRDDYGCRLEDTSAWAGIHYFASRNGRASNADPHAVVTWPEGIGWIVGKIGETVRRNIRCGACVIHIEETPKGMAVDYCDVNKGTVHRILAGAVIYAAPRFTAFRTIQTLLEQPPPYKKSFSYGPWMVANVTMRGAPEGSGAPLSWDNVGYRSASLGYVVATHQDIAQHHEKTVLTCYFPLTGSPPAAERQKAMQRTHREWADLVIRELVLLHPGIEDSIEAVDVWVWGHAMIRPVPGLIWGTARQEALKPLGNIFFAHSDMSGLSIFEEAQYRGITAARGVMRLISGRS